MLTRTQTLMYWWAKWLIALLSFCLYTHTNTQTYTHFMFSRASSSPQKWRLIHYRYQTCQVQLTVVHRIGSHCLCCHLRFAEDLGEYIRRISLSLPGSLYRLLYTYAWCVMLLCLCTCISPQWHGTLFVYERLVSFFTLMWSILMWLHMCVNVSVFGLIL